MSSIKNLLQIVSVAVLFFVSSNSWAETCQADCSNSGKVDLADLVIMKGEFLRTDCSHQNPCQADCNNNGKVDLGDLVIMKGEFLKSGCDVSIFTISGHVSGNGLPVAGAGVSFFPSMVNGNYVVQTSTDTTGDFSIQVGPRALMDRPYGAVFPIKVTAEGFAIGYLNLVFEIGRMNYPNVEIKLLPVSDQIAPTEDVTQGVDINKKGGIVGEITIPANSFPEGVTQITGSVTYIDPTTSDINSFPGSDFLGTPSGGGSPVLLESFGVMDFNLVDQNCNPVTELEGEASICMKVPDGISVPIGYIIPLWYYDPDSGLWIEEGEGTVEDRGAAGLWICGGVNHFTPWNYDVPVPILPPGGSPPVGENACFKFMFKDEATGKLITNMMWIAEGVTYTAASPSRQCNCDNNDPIPPCPPSILSFDVLKNERIRVYTIINGVNYYLVDDGDGTFSLSTNINLAKEFNTPSVLASCSPIVNVSGCNFLDGEDGILPIHINRAPSILSLIADPRTVHPGGTSFLTAKVIDPEGDSFTYSWSAMCFGTTTSESIVDTGSSPPYYFATFTAPSDELFYCWISFKATDVNDNSSIANIDITNTSTTTTITSTTTTITSTTTSITSTTTTIPGPPNTKVHISYSDVCSYDFRYAYWNGSTWSIETVDSDGGYYTSLALDSSGNSHISYSDATNYDLKYAYWNGSTWSIETVDNNVYICYDTSLALDSSGNPHISYSDATNYDLKYAYWNGITWSIETVVSAGHVSENTSLALDSSGNPHISYSDATNYDLKYAYWNGITWSIETVDSDGGYYTSLALDSSGNSHISYSDATNYDLKYAYWNGITWSIETVDSNNNDSRFYGSLALDSSGNPHISYYDETNGDVKYAYWNGSSWSMETVDSAGGDILGADTSLALDGSGNPHIAYIEDLYSALKYTYWNGSGWYIITLEGMPTVCPALPSIAVED